MATDWPAVVLDGLAGGVVGAMGAFGAALFVVKRQSHADRQVARAAGAAITRSLLMEAVSLLVGAQEDVHELLEVDSQTSMMAIRAYVVALSVSADAAGRIAGVVEHLRPGRDDNEADPEYGGRLSAYLAEQRNGYAAIVARLAEDYRPALG